MLYHLKAFFGSFVTDYEMVGRAEGDTAANVSVWVSTGRDQADVLKALIDSRFVPEYNIGVSLSLVQGGLMQAFMAGKAPDVALMMGRGDPINYALRGAVCPLEELEGFDTLAAEYTATAFEPYRLNGHCYAVPETESFLMMFCRSDVMEELHISPPETWEDMLSVAETLQRNNMSIGLPYASMDAYSVVSQGIGSQTIFPTLLLQNGNGLYTADLTSTALNTAKAVSAFKAWCEYYTQYDFPLYKDDFNRFRTGEMPLVITGYTFYNQLVTAAPEIRNMWEMVLLPGTKQQERHGRPQHRLLGDSRYDPVDGKGQSGGMDVFALVEFRRDTGALRHGGGKHSWRRRAVQPRQSDGDPPAAVVAQRTEYHFGTVGNGYRPSRNCRRLLCVPQHRQRFQGGRLYRRKLPRSAQLLEQADRSGDHPQEAGIRIGSRRVKREVDALNTKKRTLLSDLRRDWQNYALMAPFLVLFFLFTLLPLMASVYFSFTDFNAFSAPSFRGWDNYLRMLMDDDVFIIAIRNTLVFAVITGPISYLLCFVLAWLINDCGPRLRAFLTLVFYAPVLSGTSYTIWSFIFSADSYGLANGLLMKLGLISEPIGWLTDTQYILTIVIIVQLWLSLGTGFLAFIAGLQNRRPGAV